MAAQSGRSGTRIPDQEVVSDGKISIPYAGRIAVAGRTASEVQRGQEAWRGKVTTPQSVHSEPISRGSPRTSATRLGSSSVCVMPPPAPAARPAPA